MKYEIELGFNFVEDLKFIKNFVSSIQNRPILTGFAIGIKDGNVYIKATDSYKLVEAIVGVIEDKEVIYKEKAFPAEIIDLLSKIMKKTSGIMSIDTEENRVSFRSGKKGPDFSVTAMEGSYPEITHCFDGISTAHKSEDNWFQEFRYKYLSYELRPYLPVDLGGKEEELYLDSKNFDFIIKHFKQLTGEIHHSNSTIKPISLSFENGWKWRIIVLPVRVA
jgi:hypothetical protein